MSSSMYLKINLHLLQLFEEKWKFNLEIIACLFKIKTRKQKKTTHLAFCSSFYVTKLRNVHSLFLKLFKQLKSKQSWSYSSKNLILLKQKTLLNVGIHEPTHRLPNLNYNNNIILDYEENICHVEPENICMCILCI
jgi:hypothetical protein